jgi:hypothetical protein
LQEIVQTATSGAENRSRGAELWSKAKPAERQTLDVGVGQFLGDIGRNPRWMLRLGPHRSEFFFAKSNIFSATQLLPTGFNLESKKPQRACRRVAPGAA